MLPDWLKELAAQCSKQEQEQLEKVMSRETEYPHVLDDVGGDRFLDNVKDSSRLALSTDRTIANFIFGEERRKSDSRAILAKCGWLVDRAEPPLIAERVALYAVELKDQKLSLEKKLQAYRSSEYLESIITDKVVDVAAQAIKGSGEINEAIDHVWEVVSALIVAIDEKDGK